MKLKTPSDLNIAIVAGGVGTRLWPLSRKATPKQFLRIFNETQKNQSLIQITAERLQGYLPNNQLFTVAPEIYSNTINEQLPDIPSTNLIEEPAKGGTGAAAIYAALWIGLLTKKPKSVIHFLVADDHIEDRSAYQKMIIESYKKAKKGSLVVFGVKPRYPATGYGYIKVKPAQVSDMIFDVEEFEEKPDEETAKAYVESGNYYWHGSGFMCRADVLINELKKYSKEAYKFSLKIKKALKMPTVEGARLVEEVYPTLKGAPIEELLHEKSNKVVMAKMEDTWSDLGDWSEVSNVFKKQGKSNVILGDKNDVIQIDSNSSMIYAGDKTIALVGLNDMVVVQTKDAVLVCPKSQAQKVKQIVNLLKEQKRDRLL